MWKVKTLDSRQFADACAALERECFVVNPDIVVGIATGGVEVAKQIFVDTKHVAVTCRRSSSQHKNSGIRRVLRRMPRFITNPLRIAEAAWLNRKSRRAEKSPILPLEIPADVATAIGAARSILVVDDAIDSGRTMQRVVTALQPLMQQGATLHTAVITVTTNHPAILPDYTLYDNQTLIRFPWSADAK